MVRVCCLAKNGINATGRRFTKGNSGLVFGTGELPDNLGGTERKDQDSRCKQGRFIDVVSYEYNCFLFFPVDAKKFFLHFTSSECVECPEGFIH